MRKFLIASASASSAVTAITCPKERSRPCRTFCCAAPKRWVAIASGATAAAIYTSPGPAFTLPHCPSLNPREIQIASSHLPCQSPRLVQLWAHFGNVPGEGLVFGPNCFATLKLHSAVWWSKSIVPGSPRPRRSGSACRGISTRSWRATRSATSPATASCVRSSRRS